MSATQDFIVKDGVLKTYTGKAVHATIPHGVRKIGAKAFLYQDRLERIDIPDGVTEIGNAAFGYCERLESVALPSSVVSLGDGVFAGCTALKALTIPAAVEKIGLFPIGHCDRLERLEVEQGNPCYHIDGQCLIDTRTGTLLAGCNASTIPTDGSVTGIAQGAFLCCTRLRRLTLPDSITHIGVGAFVGCEMLEELRFSLTRDSDFDQLFMALLEACEDTPQRMMVLSSLLKNGGRMVAASEMIRKKIKANKKHVMAHALSRDDAETVAALFALYTAPRIHDVDCWIERSVGSPRVTAFLLEYKKDHFTAEQQERAEEIEMEKAFGLRPLTVADQRKIFTFTVNDDKVTIKGYKGTDADVIIPREIGKYAVCKIAARAFKHRADIASLLIPEDVSDIGKDAFAGCDRLVLRVVGGSYAHRYAEEHGIAFRLVE